MNQFILGRVVPLLISLKVAAYVFYNFKMLSTLLSVGTTVIAICMLPLLIERAGRSFKFQRLTLVFFLIAAGLVHAQFQLENPNAIASFALSALIVIPFLLYLELSDSSEIHRTVYLLGIWVIIKILIDFVPISMIWLMGVRADDPIVQAFLGSTPDSLMTPIHAMGGAQRITDSGLVIFPLAFYVIREWPKLLRNICTVIIGFVIFVNFTFGVFISVFFVISLYFLLKRKYTTLVLLMIILVGGGASLMSSDAWEVLQADKEKSTEIKTQQFTNTLDVFAEKPFGAGIGHYDSRLTRDYKDGNFYFENSYLFLIFAYGVFALFPFYLIASFAYRSARSAIRSEHSFPLAAAVVSIFVASISNPYLFAGGVYITIYMASVAYERMDTSNNRSGSAKWMQAQHNDL